MKIGDFGLARITRAPLRPLSDNGVVVTIWYRLSWETDCIAIAPSLTMLSTRQHSPATVFAWQRVCKAPGCPYHQAAHQVDMHGPALQTHATQYFGSLVAAACPIECLAGARSCAHA